MPDSVQSQSNLPLDKAMELLLDQHLTGVKRALAKYPDVAPVDTELSITGWTHPELVNGAYTFYFDTIQSHDLPAATFLIPVRWRALRTVEPE